MAVPTRGVERWLAQRLSHHLGAGETAGICANVDFRGPRRLVEQVVADLTDLDPDDDPWRPERLAWSVLEVLDAHLAARAWLVGDAPSIADLGLFPYVSVAPVEIPQNVAAWLDRVRALPGFVDDFVTYPENARPGAGSSIY